MVSEIRHLPWRFAGTVMLMNLHCDCCALPRKSTRKYAALGYWCDDCMQDGCFADDCDAQHPYDSDTTNHGWVRTNAVHERLGSPVRGNPPLPPR